MAFIVEIPAAFVVASVSNVTLARLVHPLNALPAKDVTVLGMVMLVKKVHPLNAEVLIVLTNDPNVTFVSDVRPRNAEPGMI